MQDEFRQNCGGIDWVALYKGLSDAVSSYADRSRREDLLAILADALDQHEASFPIMHSGEELKGIDPFTFFASFNWQYDNEQRTAFVYELATRLGVKVSCVEAGSIEAREAEEGHDEACHADAGTDTAGNDAAGIEEERRNEAHSVQPAHEEDRGGGISDRERPMGGFDRLRSLGQLGGHSFLVSQQELRFFSFHEQRREREIDLLWTLFSAALSFADRRGAEERAQFVEAYNNVLKQRVSGVNRITTALHWVRPNFFLPANERFGSFTRTTLGYDAGFFTKTPGAEAYLQFLSDCSKAIHRHARHGDTDTDTTRAQGGRYRDVCSPAVLAQSAWRAGEPSPPAIDVGKTRSLLLECLADLESVHVRNAQLWRAALCFQSNWNVQAADFASMLKESLAEHGGLLASSNMFNPYWEIMRFARREPETVREAFASLFDTGIPLSVRILRFEETTSMLYTRYREDMVRAIAKRSAHGNFTAIATYLFLRFPDSAYLYSPLRINAIVPKVGYDAIIRVALPGSVGQYYDLCEQLREQVVADEELLDAATGLIDPVREYSDPAHHLLVEDIVSSTLT